MLQNSEREFGFVKYMRVVCVSEELEESEEERKKESEEGGGRGGEEDGCIMYAGNPEFRELRIRVDAMDAGDSVRMGRRIREEEAEEEASEGRIRATTKRCTASESEP
jgi:hypothetical protein